MTRDPVIIICCAIMAWLAFATYRELQFEASLNRLEKSGTLRLLQDAGILEKPHE